MKQRATESFWRGYAALPNGTQRLADKAFALLKANPRHPSLQLKKTGELWSARVSRDIRALALESEEGLDWVWIGRHSEYERILRNA